MPGQRPQANCRNCGVLTPILINPCADCDAKSTARTEAARKSIKREWSMDVTAPKAVQTVTFSSTLQFDVGRKPFAPEDPSGHLFSHLQLLLDSAPPYIRAADCLWLAQALRELMVYEDTFRWSDTTFECGVQEVPIHQLGSALKKWVNHLFVNSRSQPIKIIHGIALVQAIEQHLFPTEKIPHSRSGSDWWRLSPLLNQPGMESSRSLDVVQYRFGFTRETPTKQDYTLSIDREGVIAEVPSGCRVIRCSDNEPVLGPGDRFVFAFRRGHLSTSGQGEHPVLSVDLPYQEYDLGADWQMFGAVLHSSGTDPLETARKWFDGDTGEVREMYLPFFWMAEFIHPPGFGEELEGLPTTSRILCD